MNSVSRRRFLKQSAITSAGVFWIAKTSWAKISPNEKLNIGVIGTANRAMQNMNEMERESSQQGASENIVALCDVDTRAARGRKSKISSGQDISGFSSAAGAKRNRRGPHRDAGSYARGRDNGGAEERSSRVLREAVDAHCFGSARDPRGGEEIQSCHANGNADPFDG